MDSLLIATVVSMILYAKRFKKDYEGLEEDIDVVCTSGIVVAIVILVLSSLGG